MSKTASHRLAIYWKSSIKLNIWELTKLCFLGASTFRQDSWVEAITWPTTLPPGLNIPTTALVVAPILIAFGFCPPPPAEAWTQGLRHAGWFLCRTPGSLGLSLAGLFGTCFLPQPLSKHFTGIINLIPIATFRGSLLNFFFSLGSKESEAFKG